MAPRTPGKSIGVFFAGPLRVSPAARLLRLAELGLPRYHVDILTEAGLTLAGDLEGRSARDLTWLPGMRSTRVRALLRKLVARGALIPPAQRAAPPRTRRGGPRRRFEPVRIGDHRVVETPRVGDPVVDRRLAPLRRLLPNPLRKRLLEGAPTTWQIWGLPIGIRQQARSFRFDALPMTGPLRKLVGRMGRTVLGDLHGMTFGDLHLRCGPRTLLQLYGLLRIAGVLEPGPRPEFAVHVPARLRNVSLEDAPISGVLRSALLARRVRTLGELSSLTPARMSKGFGPTRLAELRALGQRLPSLRVAALPFARALDEALGRLPAQRRRALMLRFGAERRPLTLESVAKRCRLPGHDGRRIIERWVTDLRIDAGIGVGHALRRLRGRGRGRRRLTVDQADAALRITRSKPRHPREFYLRMVSLLDPRLRVMVPWEKPIAHPGRRGAAS